MIKLQKNNFKKSRKKLNLSMMKMKKKQKKIIISRIFSQLIIIHKVIFFKIQFLKKNKTKIDPSKINLKIYKPNILKKFHKSVIASNLENLLDKV